MKLVEFFWFGLLAVAVVLALFVPDPFGLVFDVLLSAIAVFQAVVRQG